MTAPDDQDVRAVSLLDEPVRRRLYDWVVTQARPVGREEAATALGITRALAAFHLDKLHGAGLLDAGYQRLSGRVGPGAGRPARVYWRGDREFSVSLPERHYERAAQVFASALEKIGTASLPAPVRETAGEVGEKLARNTRVRGGSRRLMAALEAGGYQPQVEESGTIRLRNCPFHALAVDHRALVCGTNVAMAEGIGRGAGAADLQPVFDPQPGYCCVSFVSSRSAGARGQPEATQKPSGMARGRRSGH